MEYDKDEFKRKFPHLHKELEGSNSDLRQTGSEEHDLDSLSGQVPDVVSYIRRAHTDSEAMEIVNYLRRREEISEEYCGVLLNQIQKKGVRSFGSLKTWGHYEREYRKETMRARDEERSDEEDLG
jgi:hypothetical protein